MFDFFASVNDLLTNRVSAVVIWLFIFMLYYVFDRNLRVSISRVVKSISAPKVLSLLTIAYAYLFGCAFFLDKLVNGYISYIQEIILYIFLLSWFMYIKVFNIKSELSFLTVLRDHILAATFFALYYTFLPLDFWLELLGLSIIILLYFSQKHLSVSQDSKEQQSGIMLQKILNLFYMVLFVGFFYVFYLNLDTVLTIDVLKTFLLPIVLTILLIPYLYYCAIYTVYTAWFERIKIISNNNKTLYKSRRKIILKYCMLNLNMVQYFSKNLNVDIFQNNDQFVSSLDRCMVQYNLDRKNK